MLNEAHSGFLASPKRATIFAVTLALFTALIIYKLDVMLVLAAVVGVGVMALIFVNTELATLMVIFVLYTNLAVVMSKFHNIPAPLAGGVFLLLGLPLTNYLLVKREPILVNRVFGLMLVQLVVMTISAFFSEYSDSAITRVLVYLVEGIVLYFLILNTVRTEEMLRKAVWTLILAATFMGSLSLLQQVSGSGKTFGGLAQLHVDRIGTGQSTRDGKKTESGRVSGTIGEQNYYAQIMLMVLPLAASRFWFEKSQKLRLLGAIACIPIFSAIMLTFSRGAFLAAMATVAAMVYLGCIKGRHLLIAGLAFVIILPVVMPEYAYRLLTIFRIVGVQPENKPGGKTLDTSMRGRATENLASLNIFLDHPILGVGPGQTQMYTGKYGAEDGLTRLRGTRQAHNMYLAILSDTGLIGFATYIPIFIISLIGLMRIRRLYATSRPELIGLAVGFILSLVAFLSSALFLSPAYERFYWLIVALAGVAVHILQREKEEQPAAQTLVG
jgi:hypothetical protein